MRDLTFADDHADAILDGEKTVTIRHDFEHDLEPGEIVALKNQNGHLICDARIITQCELRADWISAADFAGHTRYQTTQDLLDAMAEYYPDADIGPETVLDVIVFATGQFVLNTMGGGS